MKNNYLQLALKYFLIGFFVLALIGKIASPETIQSFVIASILELFNYLDTKIIPNIIFFLALMISINIVYNLIKSNFLLALYLFIPYLIVSILILTLNLPVDCGCFGEIIKLPSPRFHLTINLTIVLILVKLHLSKWVNKE